MPTFKSLHRSTIVGLALGLAACSESPMSPAGLSPDAAALMSSGSGDGNGGRGQDAGSRDFTIWPGYPVYERFGDHYISIPANVVCDPATSGYGAGLWDSSCVLLNHPIQVTATWSSINGRAAISFAPDLRFAPSDDESRWVKLSLKDSKGIDPDMYYAILWHDRQSGQWVDESVADPSLRARANQSGNMVTRRLKHFSDWELWSGFSSYNVTSGMGEEEIVGLGGW
jgi:hypothetical protein